MKKQEAVLSKIREKLLIAGYKKNTLDSITDEEILKEYEYTKNEMMEVKERIDYYVKRNEEFEKIKKKWEQIDK